MKVARVKQIYEKHWLLLCVLLSASIMILNWKYTNLVYAEYRSNTIESLVETIRGGMIPDFLGVKIHSWGFTLYIPYLVVFLGISDVNIVFFYIQMIGGCLLLVAFAMIINHIFNDKVLSFVSIVILYLFCGAQIFQYKTQTFFSATWVMILSLPFIWVWYIETKEILIKHIILVGTVCSLSNVMRNQVSFPIAVLVVISIVIENIRHPGIKQVFITGCKIAIFFFFYYSICTIVPYFLGVISGSVVLDNEGFLWHSILAGLGVYPNNYGLKWDDATILSLLGYTDYSNDYFVDCKELFFNIFFSDPQFVILTWYKKLLVCLKGSLIFLFGSNSAIHTYFGGSEAWLFAMGSSPTILRNLTPATLLTIILIVIVTTVKKNKLAVSLKEIIAMILIFSTGGLLGTVQGVIGYPWRIVYYMQTITSISFLPCFSLIYIVSRIIVNNFGFIRGKEGGTR